MLHTHTHVLMLLSRHIDQEAGTVHLDPPPLTYDLCCLPAYEPCVCVCACVCVRVCVSRGHEAAAGLDPTEPPEGTS